MINGYENIKTTFNLCFPWMLCQFIVLGILKSFRYIIFIPEKRKRYLSRECLGSTIVNFLLLFIYLLCCQIYEETPKGYLAFILSHIIKIQMLIDNSSRFDRCKISLQLEKFFNSFSKPFNYLISLR